MMKKNLKYLVSVLVALLFVTCGTTKHVPGGGMGTDEVFATTDFLRQVTAQNVKHDYLTSKLKFSAEMGSQNVSVGGSLKMKRDAVIRIQLTALGLMEVGRLEFTPDYVLIMDRVNKQYIKAPYDKVDFLKNSGITFYTLQSLFWNELFEPGKKSPDLQRFDATALGNEVQIRLTGKDSRMDYQWNAQRQTALITQAQVTHRDALFSWSYADFKKLDQRLFPNDMQMTLSAGQKDMKMGFKLSSIDHDDDWELYTKISGRYTEVTTDDILDKLLRM